MIKKNITETVSLYFYSIATILLFSFAYNIYFSDFKISILEIAGFLFSLGAIFLSVNIIARLLDIDKPSYISIYVVCVLSLLNLSFYYKYDTLILNSFCLILFSFFICSVDKRKVLSSLAFFALCLINIKVSLLLLILLSLKRYRLFSYCLLASIMALLLVSYFGEFLSEVVKYKSAYDFNSPFLALGFFIDDITEKGVYTSILKKASMKIYIAFWLIFLTRFLFDIKKENNNFPHAFVIVLFIPLITSLIIYPSIYLILMLPLLEYVMRKNIACKMCAWGFVFWYSLGLIKLPIGDFSIIPSFTVELLPSLSILVGCMWVTAINWRKSIKA